MITDHLSAAGRYILSYITHSREHRDNLAASIFPGAPYHNEVTYGAILKKCTARNAEKRERRASTVKRFRGLMTILEE